jgi:hypothetical protein
MKQILKDATTRWGSSPYIETDLVYSDGSQRRIKNGVARTIRPRGEIVVMPRAPKTPPPRVLRAP